MMVHVLGYERMVIAFVRLLHTLASRVVKTRHSGLSNMLFSAN